MLPIGVEYVFYGSCFNTNKWKMIGETEGELICGETEDQRYPFDIHKGSDEDEDILNMKRTWPNYCEDRFPDWIATDDRFDEVRWCYTRIDALRFKVHTYHLEHIPEDHECEIMTAGFLCHPSFTLWRRLRLYALFVGHFLKELPLATERTLRPGGTGYNACKRHFNSLFSPSTRPRIE